VAQAQPDPAVAPLPTPPAQPTPRPTTRPGKAEELPQEVRSLLAEAESALAGGDLPRAIRTAQRSQQIQKSEASHLLLGRAYCQQRDLSNAKAQWRNLSTQGKSQLRKYCTQYDIDL
jgi:serine/threonine-protein kinase